MKYKSSIILLFFGYALNTNEEQENIQYFIVLSKTSGAKVSLSQNHVFYVLTLYYNEWIYLSKMIKEVFSPILTPLKEKEACFIWLGQSKPTLIKTCIMSQMDWVMHAWCQCLLRWD